MVAIVVDTKEAADAFKSISNDAILAQVSGGGASTSTASSAPATPAPAKATPAPTPSAPTPAPTSVAAPSSSGRVIASPYAKKVSLHYY